MRKNGFAEGGAPKRLDGIFAAFATALRHERLQKPVVGQGFQDAAKAQNSRGGVGILP